MELSHYLRFVWRWLWLVILLASLGSGAGYMVSQRQQPVYKASTTLLVIAGTPSPDLRQALNSVQSNSLVRTYSELLLKRPVVEAVIADLGLDTDPESLSGQLSVSEVSDTQILVLTAEDSDPVRAAAIANATVRAFNQQTAALLDNPFAANRTGLNVVEEATPPTAPSGRSRLVIPVVAAIVGMLLAVAIALGAEYFDTSLRSRHEITTLTGLTTVAEVGNLGRRRLSDLLVTLDPGSAAEAEAYRKAQLYLLDERSEQQARTLIVTSTASREGKSVTAANLAIALAQSGVRTILIDANLHRPSLHELFGTPNNQGLTTLLRRDMRERSYEATIESGVENLRLMVSGPLSDVALASKARLLLPQRIGGVIAELRQHADMIIFDSPSLLDVFETSLLARSCDGLLLVVRARRTSSGALLRANELVSRMHVRPIGVVLNDVGRSAGGGTAGYYLQQRQQPLPLKEQTHTRIAGGSRPIGPVSSIRRSDTE